MKVSKLEGVELDYWVAKAEGWKFFWSKHNYYVIDGPNGEHELCWEGWTEYDPGTGKKNKIPKESSCEIGYYPSTDWECGGFLIEAYRVELQYDGMNWLANIWPADGNDGSSGNYLWGAETPLIAACRCIVANKYGEEIND